MNNHIISYQIISYHTISYHIIIISYHIISYHSIAYHIISYHIILNFIRYPTSNQSINIDIKCCFQNVISGVRYDYVHLHNYSSTRLCVEHCWNYFCSICVSCGELQINANIKADGLNTLLDRWTLGKSYEKRIQ